MANEILSPGIYINETDQSFIPEGITEVGAAIVGPAAKGPASPAYGPRRSCRDAQV